LQGNIGSLLQDTAPPCTGSAPECIPTTSGGANTCPAGRYILSDKMCALCPAGYSCAGGPKAGPAICPAGAIAAAAGLPTCTDCPVDWYQPEQGSTSCNPCPEYSFAHFNGSTGRLWAWVGVLGVGWWMLARGAGAGLEWT